MREEIAVAKTIADLTLKGFHIFVPLTDFLRYDLVVERDAKLFRIQVKHSTSGKIKDGTVRKYKSGYRTFTYGLNDFDYYAVYLPKVDKVVYPSVKFGNATIRSTLPITNKDFYWYEDFLIFTDIANKRTLESFGVTFKFSKKKRVITSG